MGQEVILLNLVTTTATSKYDFQRGKEAPLDGWFPIKVARGIQNNPLTQNQNLPALFVWCLVLIFRHTKTCGFLLHASKVCDISIMHCFCPTNFTAVT